MKQQHMPQTIVTIINLMKVLEDVDQGRDEQETRKEETDQYQNHARVQSQK